MYVKEKIRYLTSFYLFKFPSIQKAIIFYLFSFTYGVFKTNGQMYNVRGVTSVRKKFKFKYKMEISFVFE